MKIKLLIVSLVAYLMVSCDPMGPTAYYTYENGTSTPISIEIYKNFESKYILVENFVIEPQGEYSLSYDGDIAGKTANPLYNCDKITVSNGEKVFSQERYEIINTLFQRRYYEDLGRNKSGLYFKYVFKDKDFENATPIEPDVQKL